MAKLTTEEMASKMEELMKGGKTLAEALAEVQPKPTAGTRTVIADRVAWVKTLQSIAEVKHARKVAFAKKSKAKGKEETEAKYKAEIDACNARLNELLAIVNADPYPYRKAVELGEDVGGVIQFYLDSVETDINAELEKKTEKMTKKLLKEVISSQPIDTPTRVIIDLEPLGEEYTKSLMDRAGKGDQRVLTLIKKMNFLESHVSDKKEEPAPAEPTPEQSEGAGIEQTQEGNGQPATEEKKHKRGKKADEAQG